MSESTISSRTASKKARGGTEAVRPLGFTIGEASRIAGVSSSTVRTWERDGLLDSVRSPSGYRYFGEREIGRLRRITHLRKVDKLNATAIKHILATDSNLKPAPLKPNGVQLGPHLRELRQKRSLTLKQAAAGANVSLSFLSLLERDKVGVSPGTLQRVIHSYGATLNSVLRRAAPRVAQVKRPKDRSTMLSGGFLIEQLIDGKTLMDAILLTAQPGASSGHAYAHDGEELLFVIEGSVEVTLGITERHLLQPGYSLYFPSTLEHAWRNAGTSVARVLWVNTPPT